MFLGHKGGKPGKYGLFICITEKNNAGFFQLIIIFVLYVQVNAAPEK